MVQDRTLYDLRPARMTQESFTSIQLWFVPGRAPRRRKLCLDAEKSAHGSEGRLGPRFVMVLLSSWLLPCRNSPRTLDVLDPVADRRNDACRCQTTGCLFGLRATQKLAEYLRFTGVLEHLKRPHIAFLWGKQKDGSHTPDNKLDDSNAVLNVQTRFQLHLFLAGEVEGLLDAAAELQQQSLSLTIPAPFFFLCDLTVCIRDYFASLLKHVYQRLIHGEGPLKSV